MIEEGGLIMHSFLQEFGGLQRRNQGAATEYQFIMNVFHLFISNFAPKMQRLSPIYISFTGRFD